MGLVPVIYIPARRSQRVPESPGGRNWTGEIISFFKWGSRTKWAELDISNSFHLDSSSLFFLPVSIFLTSKIVGSFSFSSFFFKKFKKTYRPRNGSNTFNAQFSGKKKKLFWVVTWQSRYFGWWTQNGFGSDGRHTLDAFMTFHHFWKIMEKVVIV